MVSGFYPNDGCQLTGDIQKEKYVYYRCTGHKGKCGLPHFREEDLTDRLGDSLKGLQVLPEIVATRRRDLEVRRSLRLWQGKRRAWSTRVPSHRGSQSHRRRL